MALWHEVFDFKTMNRSFLFLILTGFILLSSCELVEGIFKAGFYSAIILGVLLIVLVIWIANRFRKS